MILFIYRRVNKPRISQTAFLSQIIHLGYSVACVWCTHHEVQGMLPNKSSEAKQIFFSEHLSIGISGKGLIAVVMVELLVM